MPSEPPVKRTVVKASLNSIGWKPQYRQKLQELVSVVNTLTTHTYQFARFIFITELKQDPNFPLQQWIKKEFFVEVFLGLIKRQRGNREPTTRTQYLRALVTKHLTSYLAASSFELIELTHSQQIALYQAKVIEASYLNSVENYYGQHLRRIVNCLLDVKGRKKALQKELKERFLPEEAIKKSLAEEIFQPATAFKLAIAHRSISRQSINSNLLDVFDKLQEVLGCYPEYYSFDKDNRYYDVKAHPEQHINAFYRMAAFCEQQTIKSFQCFPLRASFVPGYMQIDTTILCHHVLLQPSPNIRKKMMYWAQVVDLGSRPFKPQGVHSLIFRGSLQTDGVGVSVIKQDQDSKAGGPRRSKKKKKEQEPHIGQLPITQLQQMTGKCVLLDPGRRDLLFGMHENSSVDHKQLHRYTSNQKSKETRSNRYRKLRTEVKNDFDGALEAEAALSTCNRRTLDPDIYGKYLETRSRATLVLKSLYEEKKSNHPNTEHFLFRKLRLSAYMNQKQADSRLASSLRNKFGEDAILVLGNWSCGNTKYHEPIRGIGMRRMLRHQGFQVLIIDEFGTSKHCPECHQKSLQTFKRVRNPRPYRRQTYPTVTCHGLLRCTNQKCLESMPGDDKRRLFNRDLAAVLNFREILLSLRAGNGIPLRFRRDRKRERDASISPS